MVIDTESHVIYRIFPRESNPDRPMTFRLSWHEHSGDLFVAEMDRAGVDKAFLISYDGDDIRWYLEILAENADLPDMMGGRKYTLESGVKKHPDRFLWFATLKDPRRPDTAQRTKRDLGDGALGMKIFPAHLQLSLTDPLLMDIYRIVAEAGRRIILSFEDTRPPRTASVAEYFEQLDQMLGRFPDLKVQINHAGAGDPRERISDPLNPESKLVIDVVNKHENVWLSTAWLGKVWDDESEYPFRKYLSRLERLYRGVGAEKLFWATDWPWLEEYQTYQQAVNSIRLHANFFSENEKRLFLGDNALSFVEDLLPGYKASPVFQASG
jgi:predicted TIM-barrel fold metal-dependent hydrolase